MRQKQKKIVWRHTPFSDAFLFSGYCGDVLLQKTFIEDVLTGVSKKNTGQLPQYYIENNHEGIREEIFLMPDETPIDLLRILIWYDWEHEGVLQLATSRTANTPPGKTVSPIIYSEQLPLNRLLLDWADKKHSLSVRKITRADYLEWMLQWPPRLP